MLGVFLVLVIGGSAVVSLLQGKPGTALIELSAVVVLIMQPPHGEAIMIVLLVILVAVESARLVTKIQRHFGRRS